MGPFVAVLALAFKLWMLSDAVRRRVHALWYLVVMLPAGDFVYFIVVKLRDYNVRPAPLAPVAAQALGAAGEPARGPRIEELERAVEQSASYQNRMRLGWALYEVRKPARARELFELALKSHPRDNDARYGLGLCLLDEGKPLPAADALTPLVERSFAYDDYRAAETLAEALHRSEQSAEACALLETLVRSSRRIEHRVVLAKMLIRCEQREDAAALLESTITEFEAQPDYLRRRQGPSATEARRLLRTLTPQSPSNAN